MLTKRYKLSEGGSQKHCRPPSCIYNTSSAEFHTQKVWPSPPPAMSSPDGYEKRSSTRECIPTLHPAASKTAMAVKNIISKAAMVHRMSRRHRLVPSSQRRGKEKYAKTAKVRLRSLEKPSSFLCQQSRASGNSAKQTGARTEMSSFRLQ